jgi:hypothetical protein
MTTPRHPADLALLRDDLAYHQARVLLLVDTVADAQGHAGKVDGLTKLAKLDFLLRYPALAPAVLDGLDPADARLHLSEEDQAEPADVEAPMTRYKYGPWDDRYYPVIGALVGRAAPLHPGPPRQRRAGPHPRRAGARRATRRGQRLV